jgi:acyl dehydratase
MDEMQTDPSNALDREHLTGSRNYWEDFRAGDRFRHTRGHTFIEMDSYLLTLMALNNSPLPTDATATGLAPEGMFEPRPITAWVVAAIAFGLSSEDLIENAVAELGFERIRFLKPVYCGDSIRAESTVLEVASSPTREDAGLLRYRLEAFDQSGTPVLTGERRALVKKRAAWISRP